MRTPLLIVVVPMLLFFFGVASTRELDVWSLAAGAGMACAVALIIFVRDDPPPHVVNWRRGAEGERKTERTLRPLERNGWTIEHDVQRERRANLDHVVTGPAGIFLLETKNLTGAINFESGVLVARQFDDPDEVYHFRSLAPRVRGQAMEVSARNRAESGRQTWVTGVVVVWGHFLENHVEHEDVHYIAGERLRPWLESLPVRPS
jgi:Nuclease-related domain